MLILSQIVSELDVPSQGPAAVIATVSVLCTLIILLIVFGILYKVRDQNVSFLEMQQKRMYCKTT